MASFKVSCSGDFLVIAGSAQVGELIIRFHLCASTDQLPSFLAGSGCLEDDDGAVNGMLVTLALRETDLLYEVHSKEGGAPVTTIVIERGAPGVKGLLGALRAVAQDH